MSIPPLAEQADNPEFRRVLELLDAACEDMQRELAAIKGKVKALEEAVKKPTARDAGWMQVQRRALKGLQ